MKSTRESGVEPPGGDHPGGGDVAGEERERRAEFDKGEDGERGEGPGWE